MHDGFVAIHTLLVVWRATQSIPDLYNPLSPEEQNILKWSCLLHDLKKLGTPYIEGKDHIHPFKSAVAVLEVFQSLGILSIKSDHAYRQVKRLLSESVQPLPQEYFID
jgi:hypothetical protein